MNYTREPTGHTVAAKWRSLWTLLVVSLVVYSSCDRIKPVHPAMSKASDLHKAVADEVQLLYVEGSEQSLEAAEKAWHRLLFQLQGWDEDARSAASEVISMIQRQIQYAHGLRLREVEERIEKKKLKFLKDAWRAARTRITSLIEILNFYDRSSPALAIEDLWGDFLVGIASYSSVSTLRAIECERKRVARLIAAGQSLSRMEGLDTLLSAACRSVDIFSQPSPSPGSAQRVFALWSQCLAALPPKNAPSEGAGADLLYSLAEFEGTRAKEMWPDPLPGSTGTQVPALPPPK